MEHSIEDIEYAENLFDRFYSVGATASGGVTRLGYTADEDEMHRIFAELGREKGFRSFSDEAGNTFLANSGAEEYYLVGSHLDSVIDGGRYDGVSGIMAGLLILNWAKRDGLDIPLRVGAMRCEESSNFGRSTIGSSLVAKGAGQHDVGEAVGKNGETLGDIFKKRGYSLHPKRIAGVLQYLELHIEQGRILEKYGDRIGIVQTIAGPRRFQVHLHGMAEHSGTTPMDMRTDALCAASELVLAIEEIGREESRFQSVATVGTIRNFPNAMNVVPGEVQLGVDLRGVDTASLDRMEARLKDACKRICAKRHLTYFREKTSDIPPTAMSEKMQKKLLRAAEELKLPYRSMISGAGHDAMSFAGICDTALVFIPCAQGISHNKNEFTTMESICEGASVIYRYLKEEAG